jgi:hypothetical protein
MKVMKPFGEKEDDSIDIELRNSMVDRDDMMRRRLMPDAPPIARILAHIGGGIQKCSVTRRAHKGGYKTIIEIESPKSMVIEDGWDLTAPKREARPRRHHARKPDVS